MGPVGGCFLRIQGAPALQQTKIGWTLNTQSQECREAARDTRHSRWIAFLHRPLVAHWKMRWIDQCLDEPIPRASDKLEGAGRGGGLCLSQGS